jgi:TolA-binding protein
MTIKGDMPFSCFKRQGGVKCVFDKIPSTPVFKTDTVFFKITPVFKNGKFIINFSINGNFILRSFQDSQYADPLIGVDLNKSKKWVIIASKQIPFINRNGNTGLDFYFHNSPKPYIGTIDENGNPVNINTREQDIIKYFEIKRAYEKGRNVLDEINKFIKDYPDSVFLPDVEFLKIKILDQENRSDDVIKLAKEWIKKFAYSDNLPKVLLIMAKNYTQLGFMSDASYFYQRIINEYPGTEEAYMAMIYWADQMYITGQTKKAFELYKTALYSTKDINIASLAAMRLAQRYMDKGDIKTAFEYYKKVYQANKAFILKDKQKAYELANTLASHQLYSLAIEIGEDLLKKLKKLDNLYEPLEYHLAVWSYEEGNYDKAAYWINRYLNEFPYGDYSDQLLALRDRVLFEVNDGNLTEELKRINEVLKKYKGQPIAQKALYKKVMLLYKLKRYGDILKIKNQIMNIDDSLMKNKKEFIKNVAEKYALSMLKNNDCITAVNVIKEYNITINRKYDDKLYKCALEARDFDLASVICNKYLDSPNDRIFIKWMERKIKALEGMGDYSGVVTAIGDLCRVKKTGCYKYRLKKFFALWKLGRYKDALKTAEILDKTKDIRNCDAFIKIVNWSLENGDGLTAAVYAKKIIDLQNMFKAYPYSPFVEFTYAKYTKNKKEAIKVLKNLLPRVSGEDKARALYMLANLTGNKAYLNQCVKVKNSKLWKGLCEDALNLF